VPKNYVLDGVQIPHGKGHSRREMSSGFPRMLSTSVPIGSLHEAVECRIKFSQWIFPSCDAASRQNSLTACLILPKYVGYNAQKDNGNGSVIDLNTVIMSDSKDNDICKK